LLSGSNQNKFTLDHFEIRGKLRLKTTNIKYLDKWHWCNWNYVCYVCIM